MMEYGVRRAGHFVVWWPRRIIKILIRINATPATLVATQNENPWTRIWYGCVVCPSDDTTRTNSRPERHVLAGLLCTAWNAPIHQRGPMRFGVLHSRDGICNAAHRGNRSFRNPCRWQMKHHGDSPCAWDVTFLQNVISFNCIWFVLWNLVCWIHLMKVDPTIVKSKLKVESLFCIKPRHETSIILHGVVHDDILGDRVQNFPSPLTCAC